MRGKIVVSDKSLRRERDDGLTEAQLANARAIYEDPAAYRAWRLRMGVDRMPEVPFVPGMSGRISGLFRKLGVTISSDDRPLASDALMKQNMQKSSPEQKLDREKEALPF